MDCGPRRIEHTLIDAADRHPDRGAVEGRRNLSYGELARWAAGIARRLIREGVRPGDRVAVWTGKRSAEAASLYGAWLAGAIAVPIHDALRPHQLGHVLRHSGARVVLTRGQLAARLDDALRVDRTLIDPADVGLSDVRGPALAGGDEPAVLLYTSGSTGQPKGIAVSHANLRAGARIVPDYLGLRPDDRILSVLPFAFDYGLNQLLGSVHRGATLVLARATLPAAVCRQLAEDDISVLAGVPPLWAQLMGHGSPLATQPPPRLRLITNSGGVFPVPLLERYRSALARTDICLMYGLTEAFRSTYLPPGELASRPNSMGRAIPETEVFAVDESGVPVAPGEVGELVHAGPTVALGYYNDPEATERRFRPHPTRPGAVAVFSGDRVRPDADGYFTFVGRVDQQMKCNGVRVSPDEVEERVFASGLVDEVAVMGEPDARMGTRPLAFVVAKATAEDALRSGLAAWCREQMPSYMRPRFVVRDALPRTANGKLDKKGLVA